jgi:hypothetical protein
MLEDQKKAGQLAVATKKKLKKSSKKTKAAGKKKETKEERAQRLNLEKEYKKRVAAQDDEFKKRTWDFSFIKIASLIQDKEAIRVESDNLMPFDFAATSDQEFDSHKDEVVEKIQRLLIEKKPDDAVALFREARCLWPGDKELFGGGGELSADDEFETFKSLFMRRVEIKKPEAPVAKKTADVSEDEEEKLAKRGRDVDNSDVENNEDEGLGEEDEDMKMNEEFGEEAEDEDEEGTGFVVEEENLDFDKFLYRYTHPHILSCFILMLGEYTKNSDFVNRCCMSMFERIAYECHAPQCLYQLSLFNLINKLFKDPMSRCMMNIMDDRRHASTAMSQIYASTYSSEDMFVFFRKLISKFFEQAHKNPKLYLEVLFFKDKRILHELGEDSNGYEVTHEAASTSKKKVAWTQEEQDELKDLFERL